MRKYKSHVLFFSWIVFSLHSWAFLLRITHHTSLTLRFFFSALVRLILFRNPNNKDDRKNIMFCLSSVT